MRYDTFAATAVLLGSIMVSVAAYIQLLQVEYPRADFLQRIPNGKSAYRIEQHGHCLGTGTLSVDPSAGVTIIFKGVVHTKLQDRTPEIGYFVGAFFNSLDQLVRANIELAMEGRKVTIALMNPNPINVEITVANGAATSTRAFQLPGPMYLHGNGGGTYRVDFELPKSILPASLPAPSLTHLGWDDVHFVNVGGETAECGADAAPLSLDELYGLLTAQLTLVRRWAAPIMGGL